MVCKGIEWYPLEEQINSNVRPGVKNKKEITKEEGRNKGEEGRNKGGEKKGEETGRERGAD
jgi:hypothetical protein